MLNYLKVCGLALKSNNLFTDELDVSFSFLLVICPPVHLGLFGHGLPCPKSSSDACSHLSSALQQATFSRLVVAMSAAALWAGTGRTSCLPWKTEARVTLPSISFPQLTWESGRSAGQLSLTGPEHPSQVVFAWTVLLCQEDLSL